MATAEQQAEAERQVAEYYKKQKEKEANAYQPTNGEMPLQGLPGYAGSGGDIESGKYYAGKKFFELFGRNPTASELTMFAPAYVGGDGRVANIAQGDQAIAQYFQGISNSPDKINKAKEDRALEDLKSNPKYYESVKSLFKGELGRDAAPDELEHFGKLLATGEADSYEIQQFLRQQPEFTENKDRAFQERIKQENLSNQERMKAENESFQEQAQGKIKGYVSEAEAKNKAYQDELAGKLAGYDQQYFGEKILPTIQQTFAKQGRSFDSSGFANSATQSAQQQNIARQQYLASLSADQYAQLQQQQGAMQSGLQGVAAGQYGNLQGQQAAQQAFLNNLGASQYGGSQERAYNDYANMIAQQQALSNSGIQAQYQSGLNTQNRLNQITDYNTQQQAYNQYLARYGKRNNGLGGVLGMAGGAALGGFFGGMPGAQLGATLGGSFGQAGQNAYGGSY